MPKNKLRVIIGAWIGIILYSSWNLHSAVSKLEISLLSIKDIAEHAKDICNFYYINAIGFLILGVVLGLGLAALKKEEQDGK